MWNLIKYEIKGYYKPLIGLLIVLFSVNLFLLSKKFETNVMFSYILAMIAMIIVVVWNTTLFERDLRGDTGYLLFTLPQSGYSIVGAKLISSLVQCFIVGISAILSFAMHFSRKEIGYATEALGSQPRFFIVLFLTVVLGYTILLTVIYFTTAVSKVAVKNKGLGKLGGFIVFIVLLIAIPKLMIWISSIFTQVIPVQLIAGVGNWVSLDLNIAVAITSIILFVAFFVGTSYLIENKMNL